MGAHHEGDLRFEGRVRIDGMFKGTIASPDLLEIGAAGSVRGRVEVAQALVAGRIEGDLIASERVTVLETATIVGSIETPWLDVRNGAQIDGTVKVLRPTE
jgi:cytoskeletal protein CcmA (bactofilin family)